MKRFITGTDVYQRVNLREDEFESIVPRYWSRLTHEWPLFDWKPLLESPHGRVRPDAVGVNARLRRWFVVEVELASHPESHFRSQFQALEAAYYGRHLVSSFAGIDHGLEVAELTDMLVSEPPFFLCVVDEANEKVIDACRDFGFELAVCVPHRSTLGDFAFAVNRTPAFISDTDFGHRYVLRLGTASLGGRETADLPPEFPRKSSLTLRYQDIVNDVRVLEIGGRRRIFLPLGYTTLAGRPPTLHPIDPAIGLYELS